MLILASASPRRAELLKARGYEFVVRPADIDETPLTDDVFLHAEEVAIKKAEAIPRNVEDVVLAADTIGIFGEKVIGKPKDADDARRIIKLLSGSWHEILTGVAVISSKGLESACVKSRVKFKPFDEKTVDEYIATGEPLGKAGAYAIQGMGAILIERVEGSFTNIVGLPIRTVEKMLSKAGINPPTS